MIANKAYIGSKFLYRAYFNGQVIWDYSVYTSGLATASVDGSASPMLQTPEAVLMHAEETIEGIGVPDVWELESIHGHIESTIAGKASPNAAEAVRAAGTASAAVQATGAASTFGQVFTTGHAEGELSTLAVPNAAAVERGVGTADGDIIASLCPTVEDVLQILLSAGVTIEGSATPKLQDPEAIIGNADAELTAIGCPAALPVHNVTVVCDGVELYSTQVIDGYDCPDPVADGLIGTPTKAATAQYTYEYSGYTRMEGEDADSTALTNITADTVIYVAFTKTVRCYTITYLDDDGTFLKSESLAYGAIPSYVPTKTDYAFADWYPTAEPVTGEATYYAAWEDKIAFSSADWETINQLSTSGKASRHFAVGDTKDMTLTNGTVIPVQIAGFDHDTLADGTGKAGITLLAIKALTDVTCQFSVVRTGFDSLLAELIPSEVAGVAKKVSKLVDKNSNYSDTNTLSKDMTFWAPSIQEGGRNGSELYPGWYTKYFGVLGEPYPLFAQNKIGNTGANYWTRNYVKAGDNCGAYVYSNSMPLKRASSRYDSYAARFGFCI